MKEAFEKIKERLSIESDKWNDIWSNSSKGDDICDYADGKNDAFDEALSIVSEVEAEYKGKDCSECTKRSWYQRGYADAKTEYGNGKTNADRIRAMSDEELAEYIEPRWFDCSDFCEDFNAGCAYTCKHNKGAEFLLNWLKSPTTD